MYSIVVLMIVYDVCGSMLKIAVRIMYEVSRYINLCFRKTMGRYFQVLLYVVFLCLLSLVVL